MLEQVVEWNTSMLVSAIILAVTFVAIFTEGIHHIHRTRIAMLGAVSMVISGQILGYYNPEAALESVDWNVVLLLGAMMTIVAVMAPSGGFQAIAYYIAKVSKGRLHLLLILLGSAITGISLLLDNVTTVIIFGPLIVLICQALRVSPIPFLFAAALLSDTGGVATLVGDPTALMIGSAAEIDFNNFFLHMGGIVGAAWITTLVVMMILFRDKLKKPAEKIEFSETSPITDKKTWWSGVAVLGLMVVLFILHHSLNWEAWVVAVFGLTLLLAINYKANMDKYLAETELSLLLFFMSLFVLVGGVEHSGFLAYVGQFILPFVKEDMLVACILLMWVSAILSAAIDNIPFTAAMIPIILGMEAQGIDVTPLWWALAVGVGMGGNGSHLGSTANVFIVTLSERLAKKENKPSLAITPGLWLRRGTPVMLSTLVVASLAMWIFFDFYSTPLHEPRTAELAAFTHANPVHGAAGAVEGAVAHH